MIKIIRFGITKGHQYEAGDLPETFKRSDNLGKEKKEDIMRCYLLYKDLLLKFADLPVSQIEFRHNSYMDLKDRVDLQFLYHVWFTGKEKPKRWKGRKLKKRSGNWHYTIVLLINCIRI